MSINSSFYKDIHDMTAQLNEGETPELYEVTLIQCACGDRVDSRLMTHVPKEGMLCPDCLAIYNLQNS